VEHIGTNKINKDTAIGEASCRGFKKTILAIRFPIRSHAGGGVDVVIVARVSSGVPKDEQSTCRLLRQTITWPQTN